VPAGAGLSDPCASAVPPRSGSGCHTRLLPNSHRFLSRPAAQSAVRGQDPGPGAELVHATSCRPEVALTFHGAGDVDLARRVLAGFADRGAAVTVLAIGTWRSSSRTS
jgi:hypothetical protein